jgi:hypothetical protein
MGLVQENVNRIRDSSEEMLRQTVSYSQRKKYYTLSHLPSFRYFSHRVTYYGIVRKDFAENGCRIHPERRGRGF